jgi:hypothetical protein
MRSYERAEPVRPGFGQRSREINQSRGCMRDQMWATAGGGDRTVLSCPLCMPALRNGRGGGGVCVHMGAGEGVGGGGSVGCLGPADSGVESLQPPDQASPSKREGKTGGEGQRATRPSLGRLWQCRVPDGQNYRHELKIYSFVFFCVTCGLLPLAYA